MKNKFKNLYYDNLVYDVTKLSFSNDSNDLYYDGKILIKQEQISKSTVLFRLCLKELKETGHIICKTCGCEAIILRRLKNSGTKKYYWGFFNKLKNGKTVMFTKDHIVPKSLDKVNHVNNEGMYSILCSSCNWKKGNQYSDLNQQEREKLTDLIRKERWVKSVFGKYLNQFYSKHKENKKFKPIIDEYLNTHITDNLKFIKEEKDKLKDAHVSYPGEYKSVVEKDFYRSIIQLGDSLHLYNKHPEMVSTLSKFQYLFLQDMKTLII